MQELIHHRTDRRHAPHAPRAVSNLALICLGLSLVALLLLQNDKRWFELGHHGFLSSHGAALSKSLFVDGTPSWLMFERRGFDGSQVSYEPYNRFPLTSFVFIGLAMHWFGGDHVAAEILAARGLMTFFFALTMLVSLRVVQLLTDSLPRAVATVLLAFSSYHLLTYSDMVFNDVPALLGVALALLVVVHTEVVSFRPTWMIAVTIFAASLGFQCCAVFAGWILVRLGQSLLSRSGRLRERVRALPIPLLMASLTVMVVVALLAIQILNEWRVVGGALLDTPTLRSARFRAGLGTEETYKDVEMWFAWPRYLKGQLLRAMAMCSPWGPLTQIKDLRGSDQLAGLGILGLGFGFLAVRGLLQSPAKARPAIAVCAGSGVVWALSMRHFVGLHDFASIFYLGLSLGFFGLAMQAVPSRGLTLAVVIATGGFILSLQSAKTSKDAIGQEINDYAEDCEAIRKLLPHDAKVHIAGDSGRLGLGIHALDYCLIDQIVSARANADFVLSSEPTSAGSQRLTQNHHFQLFRISSPARDGGATL